MPNRPDPQEMRRATGDDENGEQDKYPTESQILAPAHEKNERDGNGIVGERDDGIGHDVQQKQRLIPQKTDSVREKLR